jgi:DNA polymerase-3 subunit delta'
VSEFPWHTPVLEHLQARLSADRVPHAIVLSCNAGWGHDVLLARAANLLLEVASDTETATLAHPDLRWIAPDGAVIKVDQIRALTEFAVQTAQIAPRKVAVIVDAHAMNTNAANALLKVLEEPPPNTHLLLATTQWGRLIPTVRSRCQRYGVNHDQRVAAAWLEGQGINLEQSHFAEAGYAPIPALQAAEGAGPTLVTWLDATLSEPLAVLIEQVMAQDLSDWLGRWYRRILEHLQGGTLDGIVAEPEALLRFSDELLDARRQIATSNAANARLLMERLVVQWHRLARG